MPQLTSSPLSRLEFAVDSAASRVIVRTRARGMLAALAHDLELRSTEVRGTATDSGEAWSAEVIVPVASLRVAGTLKGDRLDTSTLAPGDRSEIERKIREEVLPPGDIVVRARGSSRDRAELTLSAPRTATTSVRLHAEVRQDGSILVTGTGELSLKALGVREVKAPLGAFKIADAIEIRWELLLRPGFTA